MPDVQNVFRRGGAYWWRRTLTWWGGNARPITLSLSLRTKALGVARDGAAAMTAQSEVVRMSLYERVARDGLSVEQRVAVFRREMRAYRDGLEHLSAGWQFRPAWAQVTDVDADLQNYDAIWGAFARTGVVDGPPSIAYADARFGDLTDEQRNAALRLIASVNLRDSLLRETAQRLEALGIAPNPTNIDLAMRLMLDARSQAARELRLGIDTVTEIPSPFSFFELRGYSEGYNPWHSVEENITSAADCTSGSTRRRVPRAAQCAALRHWAETCLLGGSQPNAARMWCVATGKFWRGHNARVLSTSESTSTPCRYF